MPVSWHATASAHQRTLAVFKRVRGSPPAAASTCVVGTLSRLTAQGHPAYIPRVRVAFENDQARLVIQRA
jgi:hypothetical protein